MGWNVSSGTAVGPDGWEMATWPARTDPSVRPALMWWVKFELMAGRTAVDSGMAQMRERRYIADSKEPENRRALGELVDQHKSFVFQIHTKARVAYPVRKRLPTLASAKLNTLVGRFLFTISRFNVLNTDRISSRFWLDMNVHSKCRDSTMSSHSERAFIGSADKRYSNSARRAVRSWSPSGFGMRRTSRP